MSYQESGFQTEFGKWIVKPPNRAHFGTANFELKCIKKKSLSKSDFEPHQLPELWNSKHYYVYHKHSDQSFGKKPWDCSLWECVPGYAVILFYKERQKKVFHIIDIDDLNELFKKSDKTYLKEEELATVSQQFTL